MIKLIKTLSSFFYVKTKDKDKDSFLSKSIARVANEHLRPRPC